jgi:hypothetical protein
MRPQQQKHRYATLRKVSRILNRNQIQGLAYQKKTCCHKYYNTGDKLQLGLSIAPNYYYFTSYYPIIFQFRWILVLSLIAVRYISVWIIVGFQQIN